MNSDESMVERGPAGDAFLALIHAFGPVLQIAKGVIAERESHINYIPLDDVRRYRERLEPLLEAYRLATAAYERLEAHGPGVADGAARLLTTIELSGLGGGIILRDEAEPLAVVLRKLTEQPKAAPREGA